MNDDYKNHLQIIMSGGLRTRGILYFFAISFAFMFAVYTEFNIFDWAEARFKIVSKAHACYILDLGEKATVPLFENPDKPKDKDKKSSGDPDVCAKYYDYVQAYYKVPLYDYEKRQRITNEKVTELLADRHKELFKQYIENSYTTIPILGTRLNKNSGVILGNSIMIILLVVLGLSLLNEARSVENILPLVTSPTQAKAIIDCHVFSRPSGNFLGRILFWLFLFFPAIFSTWLCIEDWETRTITNTLLGDGGARFYGFEIVSTAVLSACAMGAFAAAMHLDSRLTILSNQKILWKPY